MKNRNILTYRIRRKSHRLISLLQHVLLKDSARKLDDSLPDYKSKAFEEFRLSITISHETLLKKLKR